VEDGRGTTFAGKSVRTEALQRKASVQPPTFTPEQQEMFAMQSAAARERMADGLGWEIAPVQARGDLQGDDVQGIANAGVRGAGVALPHLDTIQRAFGRHDVTDVRAHVGGDAAQASSAIGAHAYTTGRDIAFASAPDLELAAHEAAHVVQQRAGVALKDGVGRAGDSYEQHADRVAAAVVRGDSAEPIIDQLGGGGRQDTAVQRRDAEAGDPAGVLAPGRNAEIARMQQSATRISRHGREAQGLLRAWQAGSLALREACVGVAQQISFVLADVNVLAMSHGEVERAADATSTAGRPMDYLRAQNHLGALESVQRQDEADQPVVHLALDMFAEAVTTLRIAAMTDVAAAGAMQAMETAAGHLATTARPLGWEMPLEPREARARQVERVACPPDVDAHPTGEDCHLPETERLHLLGKVRDHLTQVVGWFSDACEDEAATLSAAIARDQAIAEAIAEIVVTVLTSALSGVAGSGTEVGKMAGGIAKDAVGRVGDRVKAPLQRAGMGNELIKSLSKGAQAAGKAAWKAAKTQGKASVASEDSRKKTVTALAAMRNTFVDHVGNLKQELRALDDDELMTTSLALAAMNRDSVASKVSEFVARYRAQIEPIGEEHPTAGDTFVRGDLPGRAIRKAVTIQLNDGTTRMALVTHVTDLAPGVRRAGRAALAALADRERSSADERDAYVNESVEEYNFERWIDPSMAPLAGEAPTVNASAVTGLPWSVRFGVGKGEDS
jgi:hypothetical protein